MVSNASFSYEGSELDLFAGATRWRQYWAGVISPYLGKKVLEVGAGIGSATRLLKRPDADWTALEPDPELSARIAGEGGVSGLHIVTGTLDDLPREPLFDTILYIDVLEHIKNDREETAHAACLLVPGGNLVILGPAHNWLFSEFDSSIGHFRRYSRKELRALRPKGLVEIDSGYLDAVGILASTANKLLLRSEAPTRSQISLWDRWMVPVSRLVDPFLGRRLGKSVFVVWEKAST